MGSEGIRYDSDALRGDPAGAELVGLRTGDGDHGVESPKGESLEPFVCAVLPSATGETVYGGYYRHARLVAGMAANNVGSVTMCVHDTYAS